ncbi:MAG: hypothetical protein HY438_02310 [DPANN group archaeon]|nr:hypothetical protein [DPANN group archaeon]
MMSGQPTSIVEISKLEFDLMEKSNAELKEFMSDKKRQAGIASALEGMLADKELISSLKVHNAELAIGDLGLWLTGRGLMYNTGSSMVRMLVPVEKYLGVFVYNQFGRDESDKMPKMFFRLAAALYSKDKNITGRKLARYFQDAKAQLDQITY